MSEISVGRLTSEIMKNLENYSGLIYSALEEAVDETAKEIVKELRSTAPVGRTGDYRKSWKLKKSEARNSARYATIYSGDPHYRLTHLLENGHALVKGGRTKPYPHIKKAEIKATEILEDKLLAKIEEANK